MYLIISEKHKRLNQAIKDVGKLRKEGYRAYALEIGTGIYSAVLDKDYKTEKGARDFIQRYDGKLKLDLLVPELKVK